MSQPRDKKATAVLIGTLGAALFTSGCVISGYEGSPGGQGTVVNPAPVIVNPPSVYIGRHGREGGEGGEGGEGYRSRDTGIFIPL